MSSAKPCLPGCPSVGEYIDSLRVYGKQPEKHLPACPNAEAPKVATNSKGVVTSGYIVPAKPAPEPKQGSACPGCGHQTHGSVCMNFGSDNEYPCKAGQQWSERGYPFDDQTAKHKHIGCQTCDEKHIAYLALRAELAQAREEIAKLREESANAWTMDDVAEAQATERAAREKAEKEWDYFDRRATEAKARVRELAKAAQAVVDVRPDLPNTLRGEIESLAAILANRKKEESNG